MDFIEVKVSCDENYSEIFQAELSYAGFTSFIDTDGGFCAYAEVEAFDKAAVEEIFGRYTELTEAGYSISEVERKNWNEEWEKNYSPIEVDQRCVVRASFHDPRPEFEYEIVINPKMSFGTGHHETTHLMLAQELDMDLAGKDVLDAGCGTGILAIMAKLRGAASVEAYDIDEWCEENSRENFGLNNCEDIMVRTGTVKTLEFDRDFDVILANINRNVLVEEIPDYSSMLKAGGKLLLSGFYERDIPVIEEVTKANGLSLEKVTKRNDWVSARFGKL
ncbi:ribosomal protein L11 methyltransferase [Fulvitalea axinellae]|uniref:Ribosomal protein L11 methyltransferase n=1 Tax=Fulvitalea axinellae TaxID=1182444 RepID=A0AAU9CMU0_9BACT|nr:ribosomal protein L11 methyltransferase [Fulvitalea axinellae]